MAWSDSRRRLRAIRAPDHPPRRARSTPIPACALPSCRKASMMARPSMPGKQAIDDLPLLLHPNAPYPDLRYRRRPSRRHKPRSPSSALISLAVSLSSSMRSSLGIVLFPGAIFSGAKTAETVASPDVASADVRGASISLSTRQLSAIHAAPKTSNFRPPISLER